MSVWILTHKKEILGVYSNYYLAYEDQLCYKCSGSMKEKDFDIIYWPVNTLVEFT